MTKIKSIAVRFFAGTHRVHHRIGIRAKIDLLDRVKKNAAAARIR